MSKIDLYIETVRNSFTGSKVVFTNGSCYKFYEMLKIVFEDAEPFYADGHVVSKVDNKFYDITGEVFGEFVLFDESFETDLQSGIILDDIRNNTFDGDIEYFQCPNCDELIKVKQ